MIQKVLEYVRESKLAIWEIKTPEKTILILKNQQKQQIAWRILGPIRPRFGLERVRDKVQK